MTENEQQEELYSYTFDNDTVRLPVAPEDFDQLPAGQQASLYDEAMANQIEWTDDNIASHPDWIWAARRIYRHTNPETSPEFRQRWARLNENNWGTGLSPAGNAMVRSRVNLSSVEDLSDEDVGAWLFDHIGQLNGNLSGLLIASQEAQADPQLARALNIAIMRYGNKGISREGLGNVAEGIATDPLTYVGVGLAGRGISAIGKGFIQNQITRRLSSVLATSTAVGAIEGGIYTTADENARQQIEIAGGTQDEIDWDRLAVSGLIGSAFGGAFGLVLGDAAGLMRRGELRLIGSQAVNAPPAAANDVPPPVTARVPALDDLSDQPSLFGPDDLPAYAVEVSGETAEELGQSLTRFDPTEPVGTEGFLESTRQRSAEMALQLRRMLTQGSPEQRAAAQEAIFQGMTDRSQGVRAQALQTLVDDSSHRIDDLGFQIDLERASSSPDGALIRALEVEAEAESVRFLEYEFLSRRMNSSAGQNLVALQGRTNDALDWQNMSLQQYVEAGLQSRRLSQMADELAEEAGEAAARTTPPPGQRMRSRLMTGASKTVASLVELQRNALLSAPKTFIANVVGPILNTIGEGIEERLGAAGTEFSSELAEITRERLTAITRQMDLSFSAGWQSLKQHQVTTGTDFLDGIDPSSRAISSENYGMRPDSFGGAFVDFFGQGVRIVDGVQLFSDAMVTSRIAMGEVFAQARIQGRRAGLAGRELDDFVQARIDRAFDPTTGAILDPELLSEVERVVARQRAQKGARLTERPTDALIAGMESLYKKAPVLRLLIPFWRTPMRLLQQGARRLPVIQQFSQSFRRDLSGQNGVRAYTRARGQFMTAQGIATSVVLATLNGMMEGDVHAVRDFRIGSEGEDLDHRDSIGEFVYSNLDPIATPLRVLSRLTEEMVYTAHLGNEEKFEELSEEMMAVFSGLVQVVSAATVEQTMFQGFEDTLQAVTLFTQPDHPDREGALGRWFAQRATTFYPNLFKKIEALQDPTSETGPDFTSALIASTGLKDTVESLWGMELPRVTERRNMLGEPVENAAILSAFGLFGEERSDPVREELQELMETSGVYLGNMRTRLSEANDMDIRYELTDDGQTTIHDRWQANLAYSEDGEQSILRTRLEEVFASEAYQQSSPGRRGRPGRRLALVQEVFSAARRDAWYLTLAENPEFHKRLIEAQQNELIRATR